ncbi:MAG TPA: non-homologous end-joining DNA ligase [Candidatus Acidoferrum sp.]|nr:non-homologous end-joining DNA ligase [Candidatus Acidoferrum sp.]
MRKVPFRTAPMLATLVDEPFTRANWVFEEKYDGVRILAYKEGEEVSLISRNGIDRTARYPEIAGALQRLAAETLALDGEVIVRDKKKISRFQLLQQGKGTPQYAVFDCLYANGEDLRRKALAERREMLERSVRNATPLIVAERVAADGLKAFAIAARRGMEGILAKDLGSRYAAGRTKSWLKVKVHQEEEFVICGFTEPTGARQHFGALLVGVYDKGKLRYAGKVGTGFTENTLNELYGKMRKLEQAKSPFADAVRERGTTFVTPKLVAQVAFTEWTAEGKLRHPVFLGLRDDKSAREVSRAAGA